MTARVLTAVAVAAALTGVSSPAAPASARPRSLRRRRVHLPGSRPPCARGPVMTTADDARSLVAIAVLLVILLAIALWRRSR